MEEELQFIWHSIWGQMGTLFSMCGGQVAHRQESCWLCCSDYSEWNINYVYSERLEKSVLFSDEVHFLFADLSKNL